MTEGRRLRIDLTYDGTDFAGWQVQPAQRTVQGELQRCLTRIAGDREVLVRGAGRTDSGVHALQQVADCLVPADTDEARFAAGLQGLLPRDLRPVGVAAVDAGFHARRDAVDKLYVYSLDRTPHGDPLAMRYTLHWPWTLDVAACRQALERLLGRHDFAGFAASACTVENAVRTLRLAEIVEEPQRLRFCFAADGFLTYMVRNLVGTVLEVGRGVWPADRVEGILSRGDRDEAGPTAPARGLCLVRVSYPGDQLPGPAEAVALP